MKVRFVIFALLLALFTGCAAQAGAGDAPLRVVVTDFPCYDFARAVMGSGANISLLIKPGQDVHSFDPSPEDIVSMAEADLFIYIGGESDVWADDILESLGSSAPEIARMFDAVDPLAEETVEGMTAEHEEHGDKHDHAHDENVYDEHIWTSPRNAVDMVNAIRDRLTEIDPAGADAYAENAARYVSEIMALDADFRSAVENAKRRELIFGDRFPFLYFAREYGLTYYAAFPGCSSETEPSAQTVTFLIDKITADAVPAVYQIELSTGNIANTIAGETGAETLTFHSVQNVTMEEFEGGETYVSLMRKNLEALEKGLN